MQHLARRLNWLHAFTRLERWKEELLLAREELRRVGAWHIFSIYEAKVRASTAVQNAEGVAWSNRLLNGYAAMCTRIVKDLEDRFAALPAMAKQLESPVNPDNVALTQGRHKHTS